MQVGCWQQSCLGGNRAKSSLKRRAVDTASARNSEFHGGVISAKQSLLGEIGASL